MNIIKMRESSLDDVPGMLRQLAERIEKGEFGEVIRLAWVIDDAAREIPVGLFGKSEGPAAPIGHFLFAMGMRRLEDL